MQYLCTALGLVSPALHAMPLLHKWHGRDLRARASRGLVRPQASRVGCGLLVL